MSTRLYFPNSSAPGITPAFDINPNPGCWTWSDTSFGTRHQAKRYKQNSAFVSVSHEFTPPNPGSCYLYRQYVSPPLAAQTILSSGTVKGYFRAKENNAAANFYPCISIRLFSGDGLTCREGDNQLSFCLAQEYPNPEFATSLTNRNFLTGLELNDDFIAQKGDVLVIEVGVYSASEDIAYTGTIEFGDNSATDLPENNTETSQYCPWIEFSQTLSFESTKLYLSDLPSPEGFSPPSFDENGWWTKTEGATRHSLSVTKQSTAFVDHGIEANSGIFKICLVRQYVSPPLAPNQTLSVGTFKAQLRCKESHADADMMLYIVVEVYYGEPPNYNAAYLYGGDPTSLENEFNTVLQNRSYNKPLDDGDSYTTVGGERLVLSIGYKSFNDTTQYTGTMNFGDNAASDLPENNTETSQYNPWVEFSQILTFDPENNFYKTPGTAASVDRDNKTAWNSPNNIKDHGGGKADMTLPANDYSDWLRATNFGITAQDLPVGSELVGIEVGIKRSADVSGQIGDDVVKLRDSSGQIGSNKAKEEKWSSVEVIHWYGDVDDLWDTLLTREDLIDNPNFGVDISVKNFDNGNSHNPKVDHVKVKIYFYENGGPEKRRKWKIYPEPRTDQQEIQVKSITKTGSWAY